MLHLFFPFALLLYSVAIFGQEIMKKLRRWMVVTMGIAFTADLCGTVLLCIPSSKRWELTIHGAAGFASILLMGLHFAWALMAFKKPAYEMYFSRWSLCAWSIWFISFITGIPNMPVAAILCVSAFFIGLVGTLLDPRITLTGDCMRFSAVAIICTAYAIFNRNDGRLVTTALFVAAAAFVIGYFVGPLIAKKREGSAHLARPTRRPAW